MSLPCDCSTDGVWAQEDFKGGHCGLGQAGLAFWGEPDAVLWRGLDSLWRTLANSPGRPEVSKMSSLDSLEQRRNFGVLGKGGLPEQIE